MKWTKVCKVFSKINICWCLFLLFVICVFEPTMTIGQGIENSTMPAFNVTKECKYKVWYLEICDAKEKKQVAHLILAAGGSTCDLTKHLTKDCTPNQENDHPIMPQNALFKSFLRSDNHTKGAFESMITKTDISQLPDMLRPGSPGFENAAKILLEETKNFELQEDKTLSIHEPHRRDHHFPQAFPTLDMVPTSAVNATPTATLPASTNASQDNQHPIADILIPKISDPPLNLSQENQLPNFGDIFKGNSLGLDQPTSVTPVASPVTTATSKLPHTVGESLHILEGVSNTRSSKGDVGSERWLNERMIGSSKDAKSLLEELHRKEIEKQIIGKEPMSFGEQQSKISDILKADKLRKSDITEHKSIAEMKEAETRIDELKHKELKRMEDIKRKQVEEIHMEKKKREEDAIHRETQMNEAARQMLENANQKMEDKLRHQDILDKNRKIEEMERKNAEELALEKRRREEQQEHEILEKNRKIEEMERKHAEEIILEKKKREEDKLHHEKQINEAARQIVAIENQRNEENQRQHDIVDSNRRLDEIVRQQKEAENKRNMEAKGLKETRIDVVEHKRLNDNTIPSVTGLRQLIIPAKQEVPFKGKAVGTKGIQREIDEFAKGPIQLTNQLLKRPNDTPPMLELLKRHDVNRMPPVQQPNVLSHHEVADHLRQGQAVPGLQLGDPRFKHVPMNMRIHSEQALSQIAENLNQNQSKSLSSLEDMMKIVRTLDPKKGDDPAKFRYLVEHANLTDALRRSMLDLIENVSREVEVNRKQILNSQYSTPSAFPGTTIQPLFAKKTSYGQTGQIPKGDGSNLLQQAGNFIPGISPKKLSNGLRTNLFNHDSNGAPYEVKNLQSWNESKNDTKKPIVLPLAFTPNKQVDYNQRSFRSNMPLLPDDRLTEENKSKKELKDLLEDVRSLKSAIDTPGYQDPMSGSAKLGLKAREGSALKKMLLQSLQDSGTNQNYYGESSRNNQNWSDTSGFDQVNTSRVINWYIENKPEGKQTIIVL